MRDYSFDDYKDLFENHILDFMPDIDHKSITLYDSMRYSVCAGGKRVRPVLLLAACDFCGGKIEEALPYACAIEYIHTYSLIHDDLPCMDDDDLRRNQPTNHKVYGDAVAMLAGDGLQAAAYEAMTHDMLLYFDDHTAMNRRVRACYEICKGSGCRGMVAGQIADIEAEDANCSGEMLDYIHINKTAALIRAAVRAGAQLGGADAPTLDKLSSYAENLGLAFQISDDILDIIGEEKMLGKKTGHDAESSKATYPALFGLKKSKDRLAELTDMAIDSISEYYDNAEFFVNMARSLEKRGK